MDAHMVHTVSPLDLKPPQISNEFAAQQLSCHENVIMNYAPKEQYTIIAYIQYNQDWIRKIQVQNDYIQEDSTSTKGYYSHLGN